MDRNGIKYWFMRFNPNSDFVTGAGVGQECGLDYKKEFTDSNLVTVNGFGQNVFEFVQNENYKPSPDGEIPEDPQNWAWRVTEKAIDTTRQSFSGIPYSSDKVDVGPVGKFVNLRGESFSFAIGSDQMRQSGQSFVPVDGAQYRIDNDDYDAESEYKYISSPVPFKICGYNSIAGNLDYTDEGIIAALNQEAEPEQWLGTPGSFAVKLESLTVDENGNAALDEYGNPICRLQFVGGTVNCVEIQTPYDDLVAPPTAPLTQLKIREYNLRDSSTEFADVEVTPVPTLTKIGDVKRTLVFNRPDGTSSRLQQKTGTRVVPPSAAAPAGQRFVGWTPTVVERVPEGDEDEIISYTAVTVPDTTPVKTVTFDAQGGSVSVGGVQAGTAAMVVRDNTPPWMMPVPYRAGYAFDGWFKGDVQMKGTEPITAAVTYNAHWTKVTYEIGFKVKTEVNDILLYSKPEAGHPVLYQQNGAYLYQNSGNCYLEYVLMLTDVDGNYRIGDQQDCAMMWPIASSIKRIDDKDGNGNTVQRKPLPQEIEYSTMYVHLNNLQTAIDSDGRYAPCTLQVLRPDQSYKEDGEIFDRYYIVTEEIMASPRSFPTPIGGNVFAERSATLKSIGLSPDAANQTGISQIKTRLGVENPAVPSYLREKINGIIEQKLKVDEDHFKLILVQFQQFLQMIEDELNYELTPADKNHMAELCRFKFDDKLTFDRFRGILPTSSETSRLDSEPYATCMQDFDNHLKSQFFEDFGGVYNPPSGFTLRDYQYILGKDSHGVLYNFGSICNLKDGKIGEIHSLLDTPVGSDTIHEIFGDYDRQVRYINAIKTNIKERISNMFVTDGYCNLFTGDGNWYRFGSSKENATSLIQKKATSSVDYIFNAEYMMLDFKISGSDLWQFKCANRDLVEVSSISDAQAIHCKDDAEDLWYLTSIDAYLHAPDTTPIKDLAYEPFGDSVYAIFNGDNHLYRFDDLGAQRDTRKRVLLVKENASAKIETFWTVRTDISTGDHIEQVFIDYNRGENGENTWEIKIYGSLDGNQYVEEWHGNPAARKFEQFNSIVFGDSLFSEQQLKFHNMSKNKYMYDILDINEVDGCYYGLFRNQEQTREGEEDEGEKEQTYTVFKTANPEFGGVIHRLPYNIVVPSLFRTVDDLYSLYVVVRNGDGKIGLQEISVPDEDIYTHRYIDIQEVMENSDSIEITEDNPLQISQLMMEKFRPGMPSTQFFALSNYGLTKFLYRDNIKQISIDGLQDYKTLLAKLLSETILAKHVKDFHENDGYFGRIGTKVNQIRDGFSVFDLIPVEFDQTQDIGVIPVSKIFEVVDTDKEIETPDNSTDHRNDSVLVSTDIVQTEGMFATVETNPGFVTCAVSNPATMYDDDQVFIKSQRNTLIEGTEFYDYIYDQNGNVLMDLYQVPFIYQVNSNNTYDLYVNVPTTRTKYINRLAGTLKPDLTS